MKKNFVTGSSSFVGLDIIKKIVKNNIDVISIDVNEDPYISNLSTFR